MLFAACRIAKRFTRAQSRRSTSLTGLRRDCAVRLLAVAGRHQRADETEDRTGTDGRPEADQREAGQQIGHTGYGQRVESRVEDQSEEDQPEATTDRTRKKRTDDADAGDDRQQRDDQTGADDADQNGREKTSSESAGEGHETECGQQEHEKQDIVDGGLMKQLS